MVLVALGILLSALANASGLSESIDDLQRKTAEYRHHDEIVIGVNIAPGGSRSHFHNGQTIEIKTLVRIRDAPSTRIGNALISMKESILSNCSLILHFPCYIYENAIASSAVTFARNTTTLVVDSIANDTCARYLISLTDRVRTSISPAVSRAIVGSYCATTLLSQYITRSEL